MVDDEHPSQYEITEALLPRRGHFSEEMQSALKGKVELEDYQRLHRSSELLDHDVQGIDAAAAPDHRSMAELTPDDWRDIRESPDQFLALWSRSNLAELRRQPEVEGRHKTSQDSITERAFLESLPLLHGTSVEGLMAALDSGKFIGNRGVHEAGGDAMNSGFTHYRDRDFGLDEYAFADFGRPHLTRMHHQPEVVVVLSPDVIKQPGIIVTEKDMADTTSLTEYMKTLVTGDDFYDYATEKFKRARSATRTRTERGSRINAGMGVYEFAKGENADPDTLGGTPTFSTFEVKMPEVDASFARKFIFRDQDKYRDFVQKYGEGPEAVYQPNLADNLEVLRDDTRFRERFHAAVQADAERRNRLIDEAGDGIEEYVILGQASREATNGTAELVEAVDPTWLMMPTAKQYSDFESAEGAARSDRFGDYFGRQTVADATEVAVAKVRYSPSARMYATEEVRWVRV
ncbi:MAG TPA: hypothetical protein VLA88_04145 [Candidatus Saccharimonadales bacterium]|nr:hypothetical protein [Candidatus Saccharimonadales bacterium]